MCIYMYMYTVYTTTFFNKYNRPILVSPFFRGLQQGWHVMQ